MLFACVHYKINLVPLTLLIAHQFIAVVDALNDESCPMDGGCEGAIPPPERRHVSTSLAVVPYDDEAVSAFHRSERRFAFGQHSIVIGQNWRDVGVAAVVWDAAIVLCEYLEKNPAVIAGKRVIEIGAGTGLVGILASKLGADVTITDRPIALDILRRNVAANDLSHDPATTNVRPLTWGNDPDMDALPVPPLFDVILAADVIYIEDTFDDLLRTLERLSDEGGDDNDGSRRSVVLLACRIRYDRDERFLVMLRRRFDVAKVATDTDRDVVIFEARKMRRHVP